MLIGLIACLVASAVVSVTASVALTGNAMEERIIGVELPSVLGVLRGYIQRRVSDPLGSAQDLASNHFLLKWEAQGQPASGLNDFKDYASRLKAEHRESSIYWIGANNRVHLTEDGALRTVPATEAWFDAFLSAGKPHMLDLGRDAKTHELTLFVNVLFTADPTHVGMAGMGLPMA